MQLYHGSGFIVEHPEVRQTKFHKDFYWGFYCTNIKEQAIRWARRHTQDTEIPTLNVYEYTHNAELNIKVFNEMSDEWLDFICACRSGHPHDYDIVEGPMADDTIWNYVEDFLDGDISREAFWALAQYKHPTHQISFHTQRALNCLTFKGSERV